ncbi:MAG: hypothetical protein OHK0039_19410 [Bacteroidia bacterium]
MQDDLAHRLRTRWLHLVRQQPGATDEQACWNEIIGAYTLPYRAYHNLAHLAHLFALLDELAPPFDRQPLLDLAVWYHDLVYVPTRRDNEQQSAERAVAVTSNWGWSGEAQAWLRTWIEATAIHQPPAEDPMGQYLLDLDLAILGSEPTVYDQYAQAIRSEYSVFPDEVYRPGRNMVLQRLLDREAIYCLPDVHARFEAQARINLRREASLL